MLRKMFSVLAGILPLMPTKKLSSSCCSTWLHSNNTCPAFTSITHDSKLPTPLPILLPFDFCVNRLLINTRSQNLDSLLVIRTNTLRIDSNCFAVSLQLSKIRNPNTPCIRPLNLCVLTLSLYCFLYLKLYIYCKLIQLFLKLKPLKLWVNSKFL